MGINCCPKCNTTYDPSRKFCGKCGVPLVSEGTEFPQDKSPNLPETDKREIPLAVSKGNKPYLYIGIAVALLIVLGGYFLYPKYFSKEGYQKDIPTNAAKPSGYVNDYAEMITSATKTRLENELSAFERSDSVQLVILTVASLEGESIEKLAIKKAEEWKIGQKNKNRGIFILVAKQERKIRIEVGRGLEGRVTDLIAGRIVALVITPRFKKGDFDGGFTAGVSALIDATRGEFKDEKFADTTGETENILKIIATLYSSYKKKNIEQYLGVIDDNARFWCSSYDLRGKDQIRERRNQTFFTLDNFDYKFQNIDINITGEEAIVQDTIDLSYTVRKTGKRKTERVKEMFKLLKRNDGWYIIENHEF